MTQISQMDLHKRDPQTYAIIGAAMEVHSQLGAGFLEAIYREAMTIELTERAIPFRCEVCLAVEYKGRLLNSAYRADFVCFDEVLVELKALARLGPPERAQVINYLRATGLRRGLLLNFGCGRLEYERLVLNPEHPSASSASSASSADDPSLH